MIKCESPTEDDVLHADALPNFGETLSTEESTTLMSYLTVHYVRIPLVVGFFASRDRVTYLFNPELQNLFRAVLFEAGPWLPASDDRPINFVPVKMSSREEQQEMADEYLNPEIASGRRHDQRLLGTDTGILLNELKHSPAATLRPLMTMLQNVVELGQASVHSPDASFVCYMLKIAIDMQSYILYSLESSLVAATHRAELQGFADEYAAFLKGPASDILRRWITQAEEENNLPTLCVIHSFRALLHLNLRPKDLTPANVATAIGSVLFVRAWHGFGMGQLRSQMDVGGDPETRLKRFMQAHGIDTNNTVKEGSLSKWLRSGRTVWLNVGFDSIRAPNMLLLDDEALKTLPPVDLPEAALFTLVQEQRRNWVHFVDNCSAADREATLNGAVRIALRKPDMSITGWELSGPLGLGRYSAPDKELVMDIQACEVMWRNKEMTPVPDSMAQFADYETIFGRASMHCGVVARQEHRLWVHVVGTDCDLQEWTMPDPEDQGVGCPVAPPEPVVVDSGFWACQVQTHTHIRTHTHTHTHTYTHTHTQTHKHTYTHTHTHTHTHKYTIHTHVNTHLYTLTISHKGVHVCQHQHGCGWLRGLRDTPSAGPRTAAERRAGPAAQPTAEWWQSTATATANADDGYASPWWCWQRRRR
jgi:hypothetical protein